MYKTKTIIEGGQVLISIYKNKDFLLEYYFWLNEKEFFLDEHLPDKVWATEENLNEIKQAIKNHEQHGSNL
jgi:hypothetical protein